MNEILTTPEVHSTTCVMSGKNKCQNVLHIKKTWDENDRELLVKILDSYFPDEKVPA